MITIRIFGWFLYFIVIFNEKNFKKPFCCMAAILNFRKKKSSIKCCQCNFEIKATNFLKLDHRKKILMKKNVFPISAFNRVVMVEWFAFFEKFKNPAVTKVAYVYYNQLFFCNFLKFWESNFKVFLVANCSLIPKMCMSCMLGGQLWPLGQKKKKNSWNFQIFSISFLRWPLAVRTDLHRYKICTFLESERKSTISLCRPTYFTL
jgi:hypothetical protein